MNSGHIVIIYASSEISLHWTHNQLQASSPFTGVIRVAFSTGETMTSLLDQFCSVYPVGGTVNYTLPSANRGIISFTWNTTSWNNSTTLLMTALPHHVDTLIKGSVVMKHAFDSIKGPLTLVAGNVWQMEEDLTGINWHAPTPIDPTKVTAIVEALNKDMNIQPAASDPYFFGKEIARSARLALIADQFNLSSIAASIRSNVKVFMNQWLTGQNSDALQYDKTWGGICSKNGLANSQADFGNGIYNDHRMKTRQFTLSKFLFFRFSLWISCLCCSCYCQRRSSVATKIFKCSARFNSRLCKSKHFGSIFSCYSL